MSDLLLTNVDSLLTALIAARASDAGRTPEDVAKEALLKGLVWSPAERADYAAKVRAMTPTVLDDSTKIIREIRDGS